MILLYNSSVKGDLQGFHGLHEALSVANQWKRVMFMDDITMRWIGRNKIELNEKEELHYEMEQECN